MSVPMLRQQLLPHVTRTLAGAIGIQIYPSALDQPVVPILAPAVVTTPAVPVAVTPVAVTPVAVTPVAVTPASVASVAPRPRVATAHLAAYAAAAEQTAPVTPAAPVLKPARNYDDAVPFFERLPVLQRAS
jgi:hypothetical protein